MFKCIALCLLSTLKGNTFHYRKFGKQGRALRFKKKITQEKTQGDQHYFNIVPFSCFLQ